MITTLTNQQVSDLSKWRDMWLDIGLSTSPIDEERAKAAVCRMYECADLTPPSVFIFLDNPQQGAIAAAMLKDTKFGDQVRAQVGDQVRDQVRDAVFGSHDASWLSFHHYFNSHFDLSEKAVGLFEVAQECGWVWPFEGCAVITNRPEVIQLNDEKLLHCEDGPAIRYRDGFSVHAWRGVRVPGNWIEDHASIDASDILSCENVEQRAAGVAILGMERMLDSLDHRILDSDPDPMHGDLFEVRIPDLPEPGRFLKAECPRNGTIFEGVPNEIGTVLEAQAWRVGIPASEFIYPTVRT